MSILTPASTHVIQVGIFSRFPWCLDLIAQVTKLLQLEEAFVYSIPKTCLELGYLLLLRYNLIFSHRFRKD